MSVSAPSALGRGIVIAAGMQPPEPWSKVPTSLINADVLANPQSQRTLIDTLHRYWVARTPHVIEWDCAPTALGTHEVDERPVYAFPTNWLPPLERLRFLCFSNNYDARGGEAIWWWTEKAKSLISCEPSEKADVVIDGVDTWIDGGPRQPLDELLEFSVVSYESVEQGATTTVPRRTVVSADLAADQREAVEHTAGAARIIAPAGSGKTRTLTERLRYLLEETGVEPEIVTALAYNDRAAAEMRERLGVGRGLARTIHSLGWEILRDARPGLDLIGESDVRRTLERFVSVPRRSNTDAIGPFIEALDRVRAGLIDPNTVESERDDVPGFAAAFEPYREHLYRMGGVDHGEQIYGAIQELVRDPALRIRWQHRCRHLLVDEFQDLTPAYLLLIRLVASPQLNVFGVGDDDQVIYGYAGADPGFLIDFDSYFPGAGEHNLSTNYRSPGPVVDATINLLSRNKRRIDKQITSADRSHSNGSLDVARVASDTMASETASLIETWRADGISLHSVAVLARVNAALLPVKATLADLDIPTNDQISAQTLQRTAARALFAWLRVAMRPEDISRSDALEIVRRPSRGLNRVAAEYLPRRNLDLTTLGSIRGKLQDKPARRWDEFLDDIASTAAVARGGDALATVRHITTTIGLASAAGGLDRGRTNAARPSHTDDLVAIERAAAQHRDLESFAPWLTQALNRESDPSGVVLSSVHRVKGMEWSRVIVFSADAGSVPHVLSDNHEEERRVFHVAITRGIDEVHVLAAQERPSPFLRELKTEASPSDKRVAPKRSTEPIPKRPARSRTKSPVPGDRVWVFGYEASVVAANGNTIAIQLDGGSQMDVKISDIRKILPRTATHGPRNDGVVDSLKQWRLETSQSLSVPAYVVLHDRTIDEIASVMPTDEAELLTIAGIGANKLEHYGDDILRIVEEGLSTTVGD
jgi:ATP-dependent DNA helicase UvrD/PcrA